MASTHDQDRGLKIITMLLHPLLTHARKHRQLRLSSSGLLFVPGIKTNICCKNVYYYYVDEN